MTYTTVTMETARAHIESVLVEKATSDATFRALLTSNPHAALRKLLGVDSLPSLKITVIEEQPGEITLVLPRMIGQDELPDELLDYASGGDGKQCLLGRTEPMIGRFT